MWKLANGSSNLLADFHIFVKPFFIFSLFNFQIFTLKP
jgi:hypothetical protein